MGEAIAAAERIDPNDRRLKFYKGTLLVLKGKNPDEAESLLKSYLATVPNHSELPPHSAAREWLGKLYESQGRFSEAAEEYRASLDLDPHNKAVEEALKRVDRENNCCGSYVYSERFKTTWISPTCWAGSRCLHSVIRFLQGVIPECGWDVATPVRCFPARFVIVNGGEDDGDKRNLDGRAGGPLGQ